VTRQGGTSTRSCKGARRPGTANGALRFTHSTTLVVAGGSKGGIDRRARVVSMLRDAVQVHGGVSAGSASVSPKSSVHGLHHPSAARGQP
jgi:hypothetical protein